MSHMQQIGLNLIYGVKFKGSDEREWIKCTFITILIDMILYSPIKILCLFFMPLFLVVICYVFFFFAVVSFAVVCDGALGELGDLCNFLPF